MKAFKSTGIFFLLVIGLCVFAYWKFQAGEEARKVKADKAKAFGGLSVDRVKGFHLKRKNETLTFEVKDSRWHMIAPLEDLGDGPVINGFLTSLLAEEITEVSVDGKIDWGLYLLEEPATTLTLFEPKGKEHTVFISDKKLFDGSYYLKKKGVDKLYVGKSQWHTWAYKDRKDFRNKKVFPSRSDVARLLVEWQGEAPKELTSQGAKWSVKGKESWALDGGAVEQYLSNLRDSKVSSFVHENPEAKHLKDAGLNQPAHKISIEYIREPKDEKGFKNWSITLGPERDGYYYAQTSLRETIYKLRKSVVNAWRLDLQSLRDKNQPFQFDQTTARTVKLNNSGNQLELKKESGQWRVASDVKNDIQSSEIEDLLQELANLRAKKFVGKKLKLAAGNSLEIKDGDGKTLLNFKWVKESSQSKNSDDSPQAKYLAQTNLLDESFEVEPEIIDKIDKLDIGNSQATSNEGKSE